MPGISGGSMALILGIYEDLIKTIKNFGKKGTPWGFIIPLIFGMILSFALFSQVIHYLLGHSLYRVFLYSLFIGMILAAVFVLINHIKSWRPYYIFFIILGSSVTFFLAGVKPTIEKDYFNVHVPVELNNIEKGKKIKNYDKKNGLLLNISKKTLSTMFVKGVVGPETKVFDSKLNINGEVKDFITKVNTSRVNLKIIMFGMIAISAMLLPGISGSFVLVILGVYTLVISALTDFTVGLKNLVIDYDALFFLTNLGAGIVIGAILFSRVCAHLLKKFHCQTISLLIGFMVGAIRAVWPFWSYEYYINPLNLSKAVELQVVDPIWPGLFSSIFLFATLFAIVGFLLVFILESGNKLRKAVH